MNISYRDLNEDMVDYSTVLIVGKHDRSSEYIISKIRYLRYLANYREVMSLHIRSNYQVIPCFDLNTVYEDIKAPGGIGAIFLLSTVPESLAEQYQRHPQLLKTGKVYQVLDNPDTVTEHVQLSGVYRYLDEKFLKCLEDYLLPETASDEARQSLPIELQSIINVRREQRSPQMFYDENRPTTDGSSE